MKLIIFDTNVFLRLLLNDIPHQADQVEQLIKQSRNKRVKIIVPDIILFEINFVLSKYYNIKKEKIIDKLKSLVSTPYFFIESKDVFSNALIIYARNNISFVDSFLLSKAHVQRAELFTFDQQLQKLLKIKV